MKRILGLLCSLLFAVRLFAADVATTLMPASGPVVAGGPALVDLVVMNPGILDVPFDAPATLTGRLAGRPISLEAVAIAPRSIAPGTFALRRYRFTLPADLSGQAVLEVTVPDATPVHAVLEVRPAPAVADTAARPAATPLGELAATAPVSSSLARTFAGRFMPNLPIYFLYGDAEQAAKFQFSFDYRLATMSWGQAGSEKTSTLRLGYTQRSLWDIDADSSPFYDTSYMPEVAVITDWRLPEDGVAGFTWMGMRLGYQHESNGKDGADSRSLNRAYLRARFIIGSFDSWSLVMLPEIHAYVGGLENNPELKDYRGYGSLQLYVSYKGGATLRLNTWAGEDFENRSYQLDFTYPLHFDWLNIESYLQVQYFNGYGESLRNYDRKSEAVRFGFALVR
jgi:phospholipase A1